ncbi:L,D-transpeptidase family protein [Hyphomicrobium methylovorum]|uniref:L,D-transpeptidase family protein n=1 Tax=Hyphomicrobium methylovorum TaxID=84 RepID=UPI001FE8C0F7|nr:murein L,D-transpeptidase family protein [Hyphomicrobium methylovorum]
MMFRSSFQLAMFAVMALAWAGTDTAHALTIELKDVAADRVERQRAAAAGALPLPGTPNVAILQDRLQEKGVTLSDPILIRIFKAESELEIWKLKSGRYVLFATYPICHWSGTLGPKLTDGDRQAPEGFYTMTRAQTRHVGRWPNSLNIGYPNILDQSQARTGSDILIHGGCSSIGCFAMTNPVSDEIHDLTTAAVNSGQQIVPLHILPFRMTELNMAAHDASPWKAFWTNLKEGSDLFERTLRPPAVTACGGRYIFRETMANEAMTPLNACAPTLAEIRDQEDWLRQVPAPTPVMPRLTARAAPIPQIQSSSLELESTPTPTFSWPLVR